MEDRQNSAPLGARRFLRWVAGIATAAAVLLGLGRWGAPRVVEWAAVRWASERGLEGLAFRVQRIGWRSAEISELQIGDGADLAIRGVTVDYTPWRLLSGRVDSVRLEGLTIAGKLDPAGPSFGALDRLWRPQPPAGARPAPAGAGPDSAAVPGAFPARLHLENARLDLSTPVGRVSARFDGALEAGRLRADLRVEAALKALRIPPLFVAALELRLGGALSASPRGQSLTLHDCAMLELRGLRYGESRPLDAPLAACVRTGAAGKPLLRREPDGVITWRARVLPAERDLAFAVSGRHRPESGEGEGEIILEPVTFATGGLQPAALAPPLARWIDDTSGGLSARARLRWFPESAEIRLRVDLLGLALRSRDLSVEGLTGTLRARYPLVDPPPGELPTPIRFSGARIGQLEIGDGSASLSLTAEGGLRAHQVAWRMFGGNVSGSGTVPAGGGDQRWDLRVANLEIAEVFDYLDIDGLEGSGRLHGRLPLEIRDGQLRIRGGALHSQQGGRVRYRPGMQGSPQGDGVGNRQAAGENSKRRDLVIGILEDFRYESAEILIDAESGDSVMLKAHLQSEGGEASGGRPVEFNLTLEVPLTRLLRGIAAVSEVPREIEQRLRGPGPTDFE